MFARVMNMENAIAISDSGNLETYDIYIYIYIYMDRYGYIYIRIHDNFYGTLVCYASFIQVNNK